MSHCRATLRVAPANSQDDPIFAAIERHQAARGVLKNTSDEADDKIIDRLVDEETKLARSLMATVPATKSGLVALLRYVREAEKAGVISLNDVGQFAVLLATIERAVHSLRDERHEERTDRDTMAKMEIPLLEARGLSKVMTMALGGKDRVAMDEEEADDAFERLALAIENHIDAAVKIWGRA